MPKKSACVVPFINLLEGNSIDSQFNAQNDPQVMLGKGLADNLSAKVGDYVTLLANTTEDSLNGFDAVVVGIFETGIEELDVRTLLTHYQSAGELLTTQRVHQIGVYLQDFQFIPAVQASLEQDMPSLLVTHWEDLAVFYQGVKNLYNNIFVFIGSITFIIIFFAVYNLISTSIWERTREMGVLSAIGATQREIVASLLLESVFISVFSLLLAAIVYGVLSMALAFAGIEMAPPPGQTTGYPLQIVFSMPAILFLSIATVITTLVSTLIAGKKITKLSITQALTHL